MLIKGVDASVVSPSKTERLKKEVQMASFVNKRESSDYVFCAYIVRNGKVIYPRKAKVFRFRKKGR